MMARRKVILAGTMALMLLLGMAFAGLSVASANTPVTGAAFTTTNTNVDGFGHCKNGNEDVNCNIYDGKPYVWLNGGPAMAYVGDGNYFFAVLEPGGQGGNQNPNDGTPKNLSDDFDAYTNRTFSVSGGVVSYSGTHDFDSNKIRLMPYADTGNPGGVYILAICSLADGYPVNPSDCKYDAFKIQTGALKTALPLDITKDAAGDFDRTFTWSISKAADKTLVKQVGGSTTFNYTVTVTHDQGAISGVKVAGLISVFNPNVDSQNNILPVQIDGILDQLSDGTICNVANAGPQTLTQFQTEFAYTCDLAQLPQGSLSNVATVSWPAQFLGDGKLLAAGSAVFTFDYVAFTETGIDTCVNVTDSYAGVLGEACVEGANPMVFNYSRSVNMPPYDCVTYDNTATFTANTSGASGSAEQSVTVCGPARTSARTIGFWSNRNGQAIITSYCAPSGKTSLYTFLTGYNPYQDLTKASCKDIAAYVSAVIKSANSKGATMNAMLKAQMLATALDVYFSDPALGGNQLKAPAPLGSVSIDLSMICTDMTCSAYQDSSAQFGGSPKTVLEMLAYAASQSNAGGSLWYGNVKNIQELAKDAFDAINNEKVFAASSLLVLPVISPLKPAASR